MSILRRGLVGLRRKIRTGGIGDWYRDSIFNPGSWSEDIARGFGANTRRQGRVIGRKKVGTKEVQIGDPNEPATVTEDIFENQYGPRRLNSTGYKAQAAGWMGAGGLGAYLMSGGKEQPATDSNGVANPDFNEDRAKVIDAFKQKIGGVSAMNESIYQAASKDSQWVKTAIKNMGVERYKQLRKAAMMDPSKAGAVHQQMISALAKSGDTEMMKQAAKDAYVLPGLARNQDGTPRVVVIAPQKDSKTKKTSYTSFQMDWEDEGQQ